MGEPAALGDRILALRGPSYLPLAVARNGLLAYWYGPNARTELQWFDRSGRPLGVIEMPERSDAPALSPDATQLLVTQRSDGNQTQLWRVDLASGLTSQLTFDGGVGRFGIWSPDGKTTILSTLTERGANALVQKPASGAGAEVLVIGPGRHYALFPDDWSRDGQWVFYSATQAAWDVVALNVPSATARPLVATPANEVQAHLSPDGRWLAYTSDESGAWEVYVQPFPEGGGRWRISAGGGAQPLWRSDGRELFYLGADGRLMTVAIGTGQAFDRGVPSALFQTRVPFMLAPFRMGYSVTPDGERFLLNNVVPDAEPVTITLVRNWQPRR
jgi:eukaryotic-like serine/threonine-protein kinase